MVFRTNGKCESIVRRPSFSCVRLTILALYSDQKRKNRLNIFLNACNKYTPMKTQNEYDFDIYT